jgi:hypothetical protein
MAQTTFIGLPMFKHQSSRKDAREKKMPLL